MIYSYRAGEDGYTMFTRQIRHADRLWESRRRPRTANSARLDARRGGEEEDTGTTQGRQRHKA
eukprot:1213660-Pyramimonas_sp.AAC.1